MGMGRALPRGIIWNPLRFSQILDKHTSNLPILGNKMLVGSPLNLIGTLLIQLGRASNVWVRYGWVLALWEEGCVSWMLRSNLKVHEPRGD